MTYRFSQYWPWSRRTPLGLLRWYRISSSDSYTWTGWWQTSGCPSYWWLKRSDSRTGPYPSILRTMATSRWMSWRILGPLLFIWYWSSASSWFTMWSWHLYHDIEGIIHIFTDCLGSRDWPIGSEPKWCGMASSVSSFSNTHLYSYQGSSVSIM